MDNEAFNTRMKITWLTNVLAAGLLTATPVFVPNQQDKVQLNVLSNSYGK